MVPITADVLMTMSASVVQREIGAGPIFVHGGAVPIHVVAATVHPDADTLILLEHAIGSHLRTVELNGIVPPAGITVHVPHIGTQLAADTVAVPGVAHAGSRVRPRIRQVILLHNLVVFKTSARHDDPFVRLHVHALRTVFVDAAYHGRTLRVLNERRQRRVRLALDNLPLLLQHRIEELHHMAHPIGVFLVEKDGFRSERVGQLAPFAPVPRVILDHGLRSAQAEQPFLVPDYLFREGFEDLIGRSRIFPTQLFQVFEDVGSVLARENDARREHAVAIAQLRSSFFQQENLEGRIRLGKGNRRRHASGTPSHHENVALLVPCDIRHRGGRIVFRVLCGAPRCSKRKRSERRRSSRFDEAPPGLKQRIGHDAPLSLQLLPLSFAAQRPC